MSKRCAECTYLNLNDGDIYGKFCCEKKWERHLATDVECSSFCSAYSRNYSTIKNAIEYSNDHTSSGCYITTMLCNILGLSDNNYWLNTIRKFRTNILQKDNKYKSLLVEYDIIGPKISKALENEPMKLSIANAMFNKYIVEIVECICANKNEDAINNYIDMTNSLKHLYKLDNENITQLEIDNADINESGHGKYKVKEITI